MGGGAGVAAVTMVESKEWYLAAYAPENVPTSEHIKLRTVNVSLEYDSIPDQHVLVQLLMISVDPYLRNVITGRDGDLYLPQIHQQDIQHLHVNVTSVLTEFGIARVVRSKNSNFNEGDIVVNGFSLIAEYSVIPSDFLRKIDPTANINLPDYINCLGKMSIKRTHPGFTALYRDRGDWEPASGFDCVYILRQAGGVERLQGSLPKAYGVSSFWESNGSVQILKDEFGYDEAFNYRKESDFDAALAKYFPNGIDFYLDNVGGKMLEAVLNHVNKGARIAISGVDVSVKTTCQEMHPIIERHPKKKAEKEELSTILNEASTIGSNVAFEREHMFSSFNIGMQGRTKRWPEYPITREEDSINVGQVVKGKPSTSNTLDLGAIDLFKVESSYEQEWEGIYCSIL
ncbi:NADP(+)-dependent 2-alkenal reductase-like protein [Tanacetum coccineum]